MSKEEKRALKENQIISAAEGIFIKKGYENTKMDDIAKKVGLSKGSIYFYMTSKENLYMAITYRAFKKLIQIYQNVISQNQLDIGLEIVMKLMQSFIEFSERDFLYAEAILNYISFSKSTARGEIDQKVSAAMRESVYHKKVKSIQHIPMKMVINMIIKGIEDGSIRDNLKPELLYLNAWALILGFTKLNDTVVSDHNSIIKVAVEEWKANILTESRRIIMKQD